ncbi:MAG: exo-alpha-sialidase, partial [Lentisphaerae bacterium]|nr:exo-alpha-sialidase [Lentisphaerota bacterium]
MENHAIQELPLADRMIAPWSPPAHYETYRRVLVSPTINIPPAFKGYGGWNGWPEAIRLRNGDLYVAFCAGYDHASIRTPFDAHPDYVAEVKRKLKTMGAPMQAWTFDWDCPTGGQIMWMRSRDHGATWTRPRPFPLIPRLGYYVSHLLQLRDGGLLATVRGQCCLGFFERMPVNALEFARMAMNRFPSETIFLRSDDHGETWREWSRMRGPCLMMDAPYALFETPDGALMMLIPGQPIPFGPGWPAAPDQAAAQWIMLAMRSEDQGLTWTTVSAFGLEHFDANEGCGGYLPDGSIGCLTRPTSAWFQSPDHG